jgi:hypothetical protein
MFKCNCAPELRETAPCQALQTRPLGRCQGVRNTAHSIPSACNGCRTRFKREGVPIDRTKWLDKTRPKALDVEDVAKMDSSEEAIVELGIEAISLDEDDVGMCQGNKKKQYRKI